MVRRTKDAQPPPHDDVVQESLMDGEQFDNAGVEIAGPLVHKQFRGVLMRPIHRLVSFFAVLGLLLATIIGVAAPNSAAAQLPSADLAILRLTGPHQAKTGKVV